MTPIPQKIKDRLVSELKKFQPILESAKSRDVNESDTVIIVTDMLSIIFGYDKYSEITSEHAIRSTYCDLAIKLNGKIESLIEVKAIGLELKDNYVKQAIDYAANQGVDWVILTNGIIWRIYKVAFTKPIDQELVLEFDLLSLNPKSHDHISYLYLFSKEGWAKDCLEAYHAQIQALSRYFLGSLILSDTVIETLRRELRKISPDVKIDSEQIRNVVLQEVLKRDVTEGEKFENAKKVIAKAQNKAKPKKIVKPKLMSINDVPEIEGNSQENEKS